MSTVFKIVKDTSKNAANLHDKQKIFILHTIYEVFEMEWRSKLSASAKASPFSFHQNLVTIVAAKPQQKGKEKGVNNGRKKGNQED